MINAKKSLGQNFLIDKNIIKKIVTLTKIKGRNIIEIGPGKGALTDEILIHQPKKFSLIEKDANLAQQLKLKYSSKKNIKIYNEDILNFNIEKILSRNSIIFGNLPYNISSQILVKILKFKIWPPRFGDLIFMFQKELAEKILGKFQTKNYGRISILTNLKLYPKKKFTVSPNCFSPKPRVNSTVIHFRPKKKLFLNLKNMDLLENITHRFFSKKRKMINKNLKKILNMNDIKKIGNLDLKLRPSDLEPEIYYKITDLINKR